MRIPCELCNTTTAYYMVQKLFTRFYVSECSFILHDPNNFYSQCLSSIGMLHSFDVLLSGIPNVGSTCYSAILTKRIKLTTTNQPTPFSESYYLKEVFMRKSSFLLRSILMYSSLHY